MAVEQQEVLVPLLTERHLLDQSERLPRLRLQLVPHDLGHLVEVGVAGRSPFGQGGAVTEGELEPGQVSVSSQDVRVPVEEQDRLAAFHLLTDKRTEVRFQVNNVDREVVLLYLFL